MTNVNKFVHQLASSILSLVHYLCIIPCHNVDFASVFPIASVQ